MKSYNQVMDETERATIRRHERISMEIIKEVESYYKVNFPIVENNLTYSLLIQLILFDPSFVEYQSKLFEVFEKYNVNEENIVSRFLITINQSGIPMILKSWMEESFRKSPCCKSFKKISNGCYIIETKNGVVEAYQLSKSICDVDFYALLNSNILQKHCHEAVQICSKYFPDEMIITSELNSLFEGIYYHSYIKEKNNDVYDVSTNTLYKENTFDTFYKPRELQNIPCPLLDEKLKILTEERGEKHCKVLRLAIENKIKKERES